jgi:hypothetical protein
MLLESWPLCSTTSVVEFGMSETAPNSEGGAWACELKHVPVGHGKRYAHSHYLPERRYGLN